MKVEPEFGENNPDSQHISQYPLEDLLEKFNLELTDDWYDEENRNDSVNSYLEVAGDKLKDLKLFLDSVIGKHVFNKENGEIVDLIIE